MLTFLEKESTLLPKLIFLPRGTFSLLSSSYLLLILKISAHSPEINPPIYGQLIISKRANTIKGLKDKLFNKWY